MAFQLTEEVVGRFQVSASERVTQISNAWQRINQAPDDEQLNRLRRELHTLKGDAHVFGFRDVSQLCHKLEELIEAAAQHVFRVSDDVDTVVTMVLRYIGALVLRRPAGSSGGVQRFIKEIDDALDGLRATPVPAGTSVRPRPSTLSPGGEGGERDRLSAETRARLAVIATDLFAAALEVGAASGSRLDRGWRALVGEIGRLRAVRLDQRLERHARAASLLADDLGKPIEVTYTMPAEVVSARLVEVIDQAVLHAVRNAVDHGIEAPEWREALDKPAQASLAIRGKVTDGHVEVVIEDDGAGVDVAAVRRRAVERGIVSAARASSLSDEEATELLFAPGFSTRDRAGELSGRGIGLDAMRAAVAEEEGTVTLVSQSGRGSTVTVHVPHERPFVDVTRLPIGGPGFVAVSREWTVERPGSGVDARDVTGEDLDPWSRYGLTPVTGEAASAVLLARGDECVYLRGVGTPVVGTAQRLCPTPSGHPIEIVRMDGIEGLLVRPDALLAAQRRGGRSR
jgi:two-component system chemotaxis sensor kinase CheA